MYNYVYTYQLHNLNWMMILKLIINSPLQHTMQKEVCYYNYYNVTILYLMNLECLEVSDNEIPVSDISDSFTHHSISKRGI